MRDRVRYALPLGPLGPLAHRLVVGRDLEAIFTYRLKKVEEIFRGQEAPGFPQPAANPPR
jgi:hypothetical protein